MNRTQKEQASADFAARVADAPLVVLADYRGITVAQINEFRRALAAAGVQYQVIKNKLAMRAIAGTDKEGLVDQLTGMTGWVISNDDPIATAKLLRDATKGLKKQHLFVMKGGWFDGETLDAAAIAKVADLPSREELLVMLLRTIQEGPRQVLGVMQAPARDLLYLLKNYENKLDEGEAA